MPPVPQPPQLPRPELRGHSYHGLAPALSEPTLVPDQTVRWPISDPNIPVCRWRSAGGMASHAEGQDDVEEQRRLAEGYEFGADVCSSTGLGH